MNRQPAVIVDMVGEELAKRDEADRLGKVIVCIVTDGLENSSADWTRGRVKALVEQQCSSRPQ